MDTETQKRAYAAAYMKEHRAAWRSSGFTPVSSMVHREDKAKLAAYSEMIKFEKLLSLVNADKAEAVDLAATRNTPKLPTYDMVQEIEGMIERPGTAPRAAEQIKALLSGLGAHSKKHRKYRLLADDDPLDDESKAKAVIYGNLAKATYKLAYALAKYSPNLGESAEDEE